MIASSTVLLTLVAPYLLTSVAAKPCVVQDAAWNLLAFGFNGKDYSAGTQDQWASGQAKDITASGRPPFDADNTVCYLSQFSNAIYFTNADKSNPNSLYIYNAASSQWSKQATSPTGSFNPSQFTAILDHDTNVFFALSSPDNHMFQLDMSQQCDANGNTNQWQDVDPTPYGDSNAYEPVMALAQNHIHFLDVPSAPAGDAEIFVIHFAFFQPQTQGYPISNGGGTFPKTHGQTASLFIDSGVQPGFAFIPDDGSATYFVDVENNSTLKAAAPPIKDSSASYFAGPTALIQCASNGAVSYIPIASKSSGASVESSAAWATVNSIKAFASAPSNSGGSSSGNSSGTSGGGNGSKNGTSSGGSGSNSSSGASPGNSAASATLPLSGFLTALVPLAFALTSSVLSLL